MKQYIIGIDVGGTNVRSGLFDGNMQCVCRHHFAMDQELEPDELIALLTNHAHELMEEAGVSQDQIRGVGAAFPSYIDYEKGVLLETSNIFPLNNVPIRSMLSDALQLPVWIDNNANTAALAEHRMGAGRGYSSMVYATVATGVGGGLILNGQLFRGMHGMAGEIGHMFVSDSTGYPCGCGVTGCVQSISSGTSMARYAMDRIKEGMESRILDYAGTLSKIDMIAVGKALNDRDTLAMEVVSRGAEYLGRMFHSINLILDVNVFVYGGGVIKLGNEFVRRFIGAYRRYSLTEARFPATFLKAELGDDTGIIGAALLVPENA